ncbi:ExeM/NucH family extracellular endonuclease [Hydrogenophaga sp.]|uniref:ExeM/NucH family extracellular endonuclease n=1 Tax=Hydrogenophaga sp. TaxID=1904254 RepID=UPI002628A414|nr:ExeM/NucH family extracellular endonuclease [Hydrogenophaga sp.]MDM7948621.1 ExeM/NucH family extracellular endonuclease [Hydrogenophaga sp.]
MHMSPWMRGFRRTGLCSASLFTLLSFSLPAHADNVAQPLPFSQDWSGLSLVVANDNWDGVPGVVGYRGDGLTSATGVDPQTVLITGTAVVDLNANVSTSPDSFSTGGVTAFVLPNPTVALAGSGTADAPSLVLHLDTRGQQAVRVSYLLRDLDGSADNAIQPVAIQYRVGGSGNFINLPAGFVADATTGPSLAVASFPVSVTLPAEADNQAEVQVRIITTNAGGNDEWVGIDDISVTGTPTGGGVNQPIATQCPATVSVDAGLGASVAVSARDVDSVVNAATLVGPAFAGIELGAFTSALTDGDAATANLLVAPDVVAGNYPLQLSFSNNELQTAVCNITVAVTEATAIPQIQGAGDTSPLVGQLVTTRGVVTKVLNNGFFVQDPVGDGDLATSDGIFVFTGAAPGASVIEGNLLRVAGTVAEFAPTGSALGYRPTTQLVSPVLTLLATGQSVAPTPVFLPEATEGDLERFEGMLVDIQVPLTASQNFFLGRYGQVTLSAEGRLFKPTNLFPANSLQALALAEENARRSILLDDGSSLQNPNPTPYLGADDTLRAGDLLPNGVVGVIDYGLATNLTGGLSDYKIHPTGAVSFVRENPRPATPPSVGGNVKVGSFNVLNYFTTLDAAGSPGCLPSGTRSDCRGADSEDELTRQHQKIVPAILGLGADVVGLMEIENNGNGAVQDLVNRLNAAAGAGRWAAVPMPVQGTGTDAIRVAMVYQPARLSLVGGSLSDTSPVHNRPPLAQTFAAPNGERFSVVVNHFKSKGSCPAAGDPDADQGDGQGCWNPTRVAQADALIGFINQLRSTDPDVVVVGDLNAYGKEDPILRLTSAGLVDQLARFDSQAYSYVFDGEAGYLDHGLTTAETSAAVTGAAPWAINADEPSIIDYNTEFRQPACATCGPDYFSADPYRSSDHDPVLIGLSLVKTVNGTALRETLIGTPGDDRITGGPGADVLTGGVGADTFVYNSLRDAQDRITDFVPGTDRIALGGLLLGLGVTTDRPVSDGFVRLVNSAAGLSLQIDPDGLAGPAVPRVLTLLPGVLVNQFVPERDLVPAEVQSPR